MIVNKTTGNPSEFPCTVYTEAVKDPSLETHVITSFAIIYTMQVLLKVWQPNFECNDRYIFLQSVSTHFYHFQTTWKSDFSLNSQIFSSSSESLAI